MFIQEVKDILENWGFEVTQKEVVKNGTKKEAFIFGGDNVSPIIYIEPIYKIVSSKVSEEETPLEMARTILDIYKNSMMENKTKFNANEILDFEKQKDNIHAAIISVESNSELLKTCPHKIICDDLAIVARVCINKEMSTVINNSILKNYKKEAEEILDIAIEKSKEEVNIIPMNNVISRIFSSSTSMEKAGNKVLNEDNEKILIVSNNNGWYGAITAFVAAPLIKEQIGNFYLIPSSIHETMLMPEQCFNMDKDGVLSFLKEQIDYVNENVLDPQDFLSDHAYYYNGEWNSCLSNELVA